MLGRSWGFARGPLRCAARRVLILARRDHIESINGRNETEVRVRRFAEKADFGGGAASSRRGRGPRAEGNRAAAEPPPELGRSGKLDPVRYGDWEIRGIATDF